MTFTFPFSKINDMKNFLKAVKKCENEVYFESAEGDSLALRSGFCQLLLCVLCSRKKPPAQAAIRCSGEHDRQILSPYFES